MLKFLPIMLCCTAQNFTYYAQALCLISHTLLINLQLWVNKWLKQIFTTQNACDKKDRYTLIEQSTP